MINLNGTEPVPGEDAVDLSELAGSDSNTIEGKTAEITPIPTPITPGAVGTEETPKQVGIVQEGISMEDLASLGEVIDGEKETNLSKNTIKAPVEGEATPSSQPTEFTSLASALSETGVLSLDADQLKEITTVEGLLDAIGDQVKTNEYRDLDDVQTKYLETVRHGIPKEEFTKHQGTAEEYRKIDENVIKQRPELQQELIRRNYLAKGLSEDESARFAQYAITNGTGEADAINAKTALVAHSEKQLQDQIDSAKDVVQAAEVQEAEKLATLKSKVSDTGEIISGIKINTQTREKIFESMTTPTSVGEDGKPLNNVMEKYQNDMEFRYKLHTLFEVTKGFTDFKKFIKTSKTSAVQELHNSLGLGTGAGTASTTRGKGEFFSGSKDAEGIANLLP